MPWSTLTSPGGPCSILAPLAAQSSGSSGLFRSMTVRSTALSSTKAKRTSLLVRFASDSPLEGDGFEPSVPRQKDLCKRSPPIASTGADRRENGENADLAPSLRHPKLAALAAHQKPRDSARMGESPAWLRE